jgi:ABC-type sugar transport system permease subunit
VKGRATRPRAAAGLRPARTRTGTAGSGRGRLPGRGRLWTLPYLLPALCLVGFVFGYPLVQVVNYSFHDLPGKAGARLTTLNYGLIFDDPIIVDAAKHNLELMLAVPIACVVALLFAVILFERVRGFRFYRSLLFVPYILAIPVVGITFGFIYAQHGALNEILRGIGLGGAAHEWLAEPSLALAAILAVIVWKETGFGLLLFTARLSTVDQELYDAAKVDGATWFQLQRHVTIPQLSTVIEFFVITEAITMLSWVFGYVFTMTRGGPGFATYVMEYYIWTQGFVSQNLGIAAGAAVLLLGGALVLIVLQVFLRRRIEA